MPVTFKHTPGRPLPWSYSFHVGGRVYSLGEFLTRDEIAFAWNWVCVQIGRECRMCVGNEAPTGTYIHQPTVQHRLLRLAANAGLHEAAVIVVCEVALEDLDLKMFTMLDVFPRREDIRMYTTAGYIPYSSQQQHSPDSRFVAVYRADSGLPDTWRTSVCDKTSFIGTEEDCAREINRRWVAKNQVKPNVPEGLSWAEYLEDVKDWWYGDPGHSAPASPADQQAEDPEEPADQQAEASTESAALPAGRKPGKAKRKRAHADADDSDYTPKGEQSSNGSEGASDQENQEDDHVDLPATFTTDYDKFTLKKALDGNGLTLSQRRIGRGGRPKEITVPMTAFELLERAMHSIINQAA